METEGGVEFTDETEGNIVSDSDTHLLTFSELPIDQAVGNSAILEREFTSNINLRGLLVTFMGTAPSVTSGQAEGATTPKAGSTSPQSVKITFTLYTRKEDETDFKQVVIDNTTSEVSVNIFELIHLFRCVLLVNLNQQPLIKYFIIKQEL